MAKRSKSKKTIMAMKDMGHIKMHAKKVHKLGKHAAKRSVNKG
jgi:hypothetical protein